MQGSCKIAMVVTGLTIGGAEKVAVDLAIGLSKDEKKIVKVISLGERVSNQFTDLLKKNDVECCFLGDGNPVFYKKIFRIFRVLEKYNPDIVHVHMDMRYTWIWSLFNKRKILFTIHSQPIRIFDKKSKILCKFLNKKNLIKFIAVSKTITNETQELLKDVNINIKTIYNPVNIPSYNEVLLVKEKKDEIKFVNVARFIKLKNHKLLLDAFSEVIKKNDKVHLTLVGDGELLEKMKNYVINKKIEKYVTFTGNIKNVDEILKKSDIFILSSITEAFPVSIIEAMSYGLPIISTNVGGIKEVIENNGILVQSQDKNQLIKAMFTMINNAGLRMQYSKNSIEKSYEFSTDKIVKQYSEVYDEWFIKN